MLLAASLGILDASIDEGDTGNPVLDFSVVLSEPATSTFHVDYVTVNGDAKKSDFDEIGNWVTGDFETAGGTITFNAGDQQRPIQIRLNSDVDVEDDETFFVQVTRVTDESGLEIDPTDGAIIVGDSRAIGTIVNDDQRNVFADLLRKAGPQDVVDGLMVGLQEIEDGVVAAVEGVSELPIVGEQIREVIQPFLDDVSAARTQLQARIVDLYNGIGLGPNDDLIDGFQQTIFTVFGPSGLDVLQDGFDAGTGISRDDIRLSFGFDDIVVNATGADGEDGVPDPDTDWMQFDFHIGQREIIDKAFNPSITSDLIPGLDTLGFALDGTDGLRFDFRWDLRFGFGVSAKYGLTLDDYFYLNSGAVNASETPIEELRASIDISSAPPKDDDGNDEATGDNGLSATGAIGIFSATIADGVPLAVDITAPQGIKTDLIDLDHYDADFTLLIQDDNRSKDEPEGVFEFPVSYRSPANGENLATFLINLNTEVANVLGAAHSPYAGLVSPVTVTFSTDRINGVVNPELPTTPSLVFGANYPEISSMTILGGAEYGFKEDSGYGSAADGGQSDDGRSTGIGFIAGQQSVGDGFVQELNANTLAPADGLLMQDAKFFLFLDDERVIISIRELVNRKVTTLEDRLGEKSLETVVRDAVNHAISQQTSADPIEVDIQNGKFVFRSTGNASRNAPVLRVDYVSEDRSKITTAFTVDLVDPDWSLRSDLQNPNDQKYRDRINRGDLDSVSSTSDFFSLFEPKLESKVGLKLRANAKLDDLPGFVAQDLGLADGRLGLPEVTFDFVFDASAKADFTKTGTDIFKISLDGLAFENVTVDLGSLINSAVIPVANVIGETLQPITTVIDYLDQDIPLLDDIGITKANGGSYTLKDLGGDINSLTGFVDAIDAVAGYAGQFTDFLANYDGRPISFGCFEYNESAGTLLPCAVSTVIDQTTSVGLDNFLFTNGNLFLQSGGLQFDILLPENIIKMLIGQNADLISFNMPTIDLDLDADFGFNFESLSATFNADASLDTAAGFVYDTEGIRQIAEAIRQNQTPDWTAILDGFYLRNQVGPEVDLDASLSGSAGVEISATDLTPSFSANVSLTLGGGVEFDIIDPNEDGALRLDEIFSVTNNFSDPEQLFCLFNISGGINGSFDLDAKLDGVDLIPPDFDAEIDANLSLQDILGVTNSCVAGSVQPTLATVVTENGETILRLNTGPYSEDRIEGDLDDSDSPIVISVDQSGNDFLVTGFGAVDQKYTGPFDRIVGIGDAIGDRFDLSNVSIPVELDGKGGSDDLDGGSAGDTILGGDGDDVIDPGSGDDTVELGIGLNSVIASSGSDYVDARLNDGSFIYSGDNVGDTVLGSNYDDTISGSHVKGRSGNDLITGLGTGAELDGGSGDDSIFGTSGDDVILGGAGNDTLVGFVGLDTLKGGSGNDSLTAGYGDILVEGGSGTDDLLFDLSSETLSAPIVDVHLAAIEVEDGSVVVSTPFRGISDLTIHLGGTDDELVVNATNIPVTVNTFAGNDNVFILSADAPITLDTGIDDDWVWITGHQADVDVDTRNGTDQLTISRTGVTAPQTGSITANFVAGFGAGKVTYDNTTLENLVISLGDGDDQITVFDTSANLITSIDGGKGDDFIGINQVSGRTVVAGGDDDDVASLIVNSSAAYVSSEFPSAGGVPLLGFTVETLHVDNRTNSNQIDWRLEDRFVIAIDPSTKTEYDLVDAIGVNDVLFLGASDGKDQLTVADLAEVDKYIDINDQTVDIRQGEKILAFDDANQQLEPRYNVTPSLDAPIDLVFSPDGKHAYVREDEGIQIFEVDTNDSNRLYPIGFHRRSSMGSGWYGEMAISPDGQNLYVASGEGLFSFLRDGVTGDLAYLNVIGSNAGFISLHVSADGSMVYGLDTGAPDDRVIYYSRNANNLGLLTNIGQRSTKADLDLLPKPPKDYYTLLDFEFSSDGKNAYWLGGNENTQNSDYAQLVTFDIRSDGIFSFADAISINVNSGGYIGLSPEGKSLYYVINGVNTPIRLYDRDTSTGLLTYDSQVSLQGESSVFGAEDLRFNASGDRMYLTDESGSSRYLRTYERKVDSKLTFLSSIQIGPASGSSSGFGRMEVDPSGKTLYVPSIADSTVRVFDITGSTPQSIQTIDDGQPLDRLVPTLDDLVFTSDRRHAYAVSADGVLVQFNVNATTGALTEVTSVWGSTIGIDGLSDATDLAISPDGAFVYVASPTEGKVGIFSRDVLFGTLTPVGSYAKTGASTLEMGPAGDTLYIAGSDKQVDVLSRNATTGVLTKETSFDAGGVASDFVVTPNGKFIYSASPVAGVVQVQERVAIDDYQLVKNHAVADALSLKSSSDGQSLYVGTHDGRLLVHAIGADGQLTVTQELDNETEGIRGMGRVNGIEISANGQYLFAASSLDQTIVTFRRDTSDGSLIPVQRTRQGSLGATGLTNLTSMVLSPAGDRLYVTSNDFAFGGWASYDIDQSPSKQPEQYRTRFDDLIASLSVQSAGQNDTVSVITPDVITTFIDTLGGEDIITVSRQNARLEIDSGPGDDFVEARDVVSGSFLVDTSDGNDEVVLWKLGLASAGLSMGVGQDRITINGAAIDGSVGVSGDDPTSFPGDTLIFLTGGAIPTGDLTLPTGDITVPGKGTVYFNSIEDLITANLPTASITQPLAINEGQGLNLVGAYSVVATGSFEYDWDLDGDGFFDDATGATPSFTWNDLVTLGIDDDGVYPIAVRVNNSGGKSIGSTTLTVNNVAPSLTMSTPATMTQYLPFDLQLSATDSGDDRIERWEVDWGDGTSDTYYGDQVLVPHLYDISGSVTISVDAFDEDGGPYSKSSTVTVQSLPARSRAISGSTSVLEGAPATLTFTATGGTTIAKEWFVDFGDGNTTTTTGGNLSHTYVDDGTYVVSAVVRESDGSYRDATNELTVTVANVIPVINHVSSSPINEGSVFELKLAAADPGDDTIALWSVNWGDGSTEAYAGNTTRFTHRYADDSGNQTGGAYSVQVLALDEDGIHAAAPINLTVANVANPMVSAPATVDEDAVYTLYLTNNDPGDDTTTEWIVDWGDGNVESFSENASELRQVSHVFTDGPVTRTVSATMVDEDGSHQANSLTVDVLNVVPRPAIAGPTTTYEGDTLVVMLQNNAPTDTLISTWEINWGDGATETIQANPNSDSTRATHQFTDGKQFLTLTARAIDAAGDTYTAESLGVTVWNRAPAVQLEHAQVIVEGSSLDLRLSDIIDPGLDTVSSYVIDWGDGTIDTVSAVQLQTQNRTVSHLFRDNSEPNPNVLYTIVVDVIDEDGTHEQAGITSVRVVNATPVASAGGPYQILIPDTTKVVEGAMTDAGPDDTHLFQWDFDGDGVFGETGSDAANGNEVGVNATFDVVGAAPGTVFDVGLVVTDDDGGVSQIATTTIQYLSIPKINGVTWGTAEINENDVAELVIDFSDADPNQIHTITVDWGDATDPTIVTLPVGNRSVTLPHRYLDDNPTETPLDLYDVGIVVANSVADDSAEASIQVSNLPPEINELDSDASSLLEKSEDNVVAISGSVADVGSIDTHSATIHWGDGSAPETVSVDSLTRTFAGAHTYVESGIYEITVTVTDDDSGKSIASKTDAIVGGVGLVNGTLFIIGTDGRDKIDFHYDKSSDELTVDAKLNQIVPDNTDDPESYAERIRRTLPASSVQRVVSFLCGGNDHYDGQIGSVNADDNSNSIVLRHIVFGGDGNDKLHGGDGDDALLGGAGLDDLKGRDGNDILVGGTDDDKLYGDSGNDLLIGDAIGINQAQASVVSAVDAALDHWGVGDLDSAALALGGVFNDDAKDKLHDRKGSNEFVESGHQPNWIWWYDVSGDGQLSAIDALLVINHLGLDFDAEGEETNTSDAEFFDVNSDGTLSPSDALVLINQISSQSDSLVDETAGTIEQPSWILEVDSVFSVDDEVLARDPGTLF